MDKLIAEFPKNIADACEIAEQVDLSSLKKEYNNILICGMGGSGIGGKLVSQWVVEEIQVPITSIQDYRIPAFVDEKTLIIASSYSGNTEETLIAMKSAVAKGGTVVAISSGGELVKYCIENNFAYIKVPGGNPPRTALAFSIVQLVNIFFKAGLISEEKLNDIKTCRSFLNKELVDIKEEAKKLAAFLENSIPAFYASSIFEAVAIRARQQFNENSKLLCWHHVIPEMNHNELVGWGGGSETFSAVFLHSSFIHERNQKRFEISEEIVGKKTKKIYHLHPQGNSIIQESMYIIHVVDWASWYLAEIKKEDAMEIKVIDHLKNELSKF